MAAGISKTANDIESIREELDSKLIEMERKAAEANRSEANNNKSLLIVSEVDMEVANYAMRIAKIERETQELYSRMATLVCETVPSRPKSVTHTTHSLIHSFDWEMKRQHLLMLKIKQHKAAMLKKIGLLEQEVMDLDQVMKGMQRKIDVMNEKDKKIENLLQNSKKEFAESRKNLHYVLEKLFPDDDHRMKSLLEDLSAAYFSDEEEKKWVDVREHFLSHVELLLQFGVIMEKPDDSCFVALTL